MITDDRQITAWDGMDRRCGGVDRRAVPPLVMEASYMRDLFDDESSSNKPKTILSESYNAMSSREFSRVELAFMKLQ